MPDPPAPLAISAQLARASGDLLRGYYRSSDNTARLKADRTLVTAADEASDRHLRAGLAAHFPNDEILSEESGTVYTGQGEHTWVLDPLDGTVNFSLGLPIWGVLITRFTAGMPDLAVSYFPLLDELYTVEKGQGAQCNGETLKLAAATHQRPISFFSCCSRTHRRYQVSVPYKTRILGSAAYTFCAVAAGKAILGFEATPKLWDIAGGWLLVEEAGGVMALMQGSHPFPLTPGQDYSAVSFSTLCAFDQHNLEIGRQHLVQKGSTDGSEMPGRRLG